jgi:hypothetical protein
MTGGVFLGACAWCDRPAFGECHRARLQLVVCSPYCRSRLSPIRYEISPVRLPYKPAPSPEIAPRPLRAIPKTKVHSCICAECGEAFESPQYVRKFCGFVCHSVAASRRGRETWAHLAEVGLKNNRNQREPGHD